MLRASAGAVSAIENIAVGAFGACLGGEFVAGLLRGGARSTGLTPGNVALAVGFSIFLLLMLRLMRAAVGPLAPRKRRARR